MLLTVGHAIYFYEKTRRSDSGNPEKISLAHGMAAVQELNFSVDDLKSFTPAFRLLLSHRDKGYVSLMHVQAQFSNHHQQSSLDYSSTDEDTSVTMGGL